MLILVMIGLPVMIQGVPIMQSKKGSRAEDRADFFSYNAEDDLSELEMLAQNGDAARGGENNGETRAGGPVLLELMQGGDDHSAECKGVYRGPGNIALHCAECSAMQGGTVCSGFFAENRFFAGIREELCLSGGATRSFLSSPKCKEVPEQFSAKKKSAPRGGVSSELTPPCILQ